MRGRSRATAWIVVIICMTGLWLGTPPLVWGKVFFYALNLDGTLIKYDPDLDQIVAQRQVGQGYIQPGFEDSPERQQTRILDVKRQRLVSIDQNKTGQIALVNLTTGVATPVRYDPLGKESEFRQFIYPRQASRFYVHWLRESPNDPQDTFVTAVSPDGQILGSTRPPFNEIQWPVYDPDGKRFYIFDEQDLTKLHLIDGETLSILTTFDLSSHARSGYSGPGLNDVRDGRALLAMGPTGIAVPWTLFTTDLTFNPTSASPRIATGIDAQTARLVPGGQTIVVQEARPSREVVGAGKLHFFDLTSGAKVGSLSFAAPEGAAILGFHPDGRRLFVLTWVFDGTTSTRLVIVDAIARTVLRERPFATIGVAHDFVDEP